MATASLKTGKNIDSGLEVEYSTEYAERRQVKKGRGIYYAVNANTPSDFYVVTSSDYVNSVQFTNKMEQIYFNDNVYLLDENCLHVGYPVAARYFSDLLWYRAKLLALDDGNGDYQIEFVDFGNRQTNSFSQLRALPGSMAACPPMALNCRLLGAENLDPNDEQAAKNFCHWLFKECQKGKCVVDFLTDTPPYIVRMWHTDSGVEMVPQLLGTVRKSPVPVGKPSSTNGEIFTTVPVMAPETGAINKSSVTVTNPLLPNNKSSPVSANNNNAQAVVRKRDAATQTADFSKTLKNETKINILIKEMLPNICSRMSLSDGD